MIFFIVNAWILCRIANALEHRRLTSVCPTDNKDPEVGILGSKFSGFSETFELVLDPGEHECMLIWKIKGIRKGFVCKLKRRIFSAAVLFISR